jgi:hypothetical protein
MTLTEPKAVIFSWSIIKFTQLVGSCALDSGATFICELFFFVLVNWHQTWHFCAKIACHPSLKLLALDYIRQFIRGKSYIQPNKTDLKVYWEHCLKLNGLETSNILCWSVSVYSYCIASDLASVDRCISFSVEALKGPFYESVISRNCTNRLNCSQSLKMNSSAVWCTWRTVTVHVCSCHNSCTGRQYECVGCQYYGLVSRINKRQLIHKNTV